MLKEQHKEGMVLKSIKKYRKYIRVKNKQFNFKKLYLKRYLKRILKKGRRIKWMYK